MRVHRGPTSGVSREFFSDQVSARTRKEEEERRRKRNPDERGAKVADRKNNDKVI